MGWFTRERRGVSWMDQSLESVSAPPGHLLMFFGLLMLVMYYSIRSDYEEKMKETKMELRLFLVILLPLLVILASHVTINWYDVRDTSQVVYETLQEEGSSPWGVALVLLLVLFMANYHSSIHSAWFRS
ncbi:hypothetical protein POM88_016710 [Heracleum sosnowskyi]|uniref:Uncharacterized protein n=1 Tax=Heracleum sosnowskyi TaxID=360622 RepID=A0AAD8MXN8_9APIA|nr:hypothetical protein POM88_016710 [Heracleum sosnowskyi]